MPYVYKPCGEAGIAIICAGRRRSGRGRGRLLDPRPLTLTQPQVVSWEPSTIVGPPRPPFVLPNCVQSQWEWECSHLWLLLLLRQLAVVGMVLVQGNCSRSETSTVQIRMDTATAGHRHLMTSPPARNVRVFVSGSRVPPPGAGPNLPTHHLLLQRPPPLPHPAQSPPKLAPSSSSTFGLPPRVHDEAPRSARATRAGPPRTRARSVLAVCDPMLQCILQVRAGELFGSFPVSRVGPVLDTWL